jgi:hypothetical protein
MAVNTRFRKACTEVRRTGAGADYLVEGAATATVPSILPLRFALIGTGTLLCHDLSYSVTVGLRKSLIRVWKTCTWMP